MSSGYSSERARLHDELVTQAVKELRSRGYEAEELDVDGHRPDIFIRDEDAYLDIKTGGPNLAIEINSILEYHRIQVMEQRPVFIGHSDPTHPEKRKVYIHTLHTLVPKHGPKRPTGNGSNDNWSLWEPAHKTGTYFGEFFPAKEPF